MSNVGTGTRIWVGSRITAIVAAVWSVSDGPRSIGCSGRLAR
jgi:hypothetical protein